MKNRLYMIIFGLIFICTSSVNGENRDLFNEGIKYYDSKKYEKALKCFLNVEKKIKNENVYFNIGNCYFKLGKIGLAILYYERAKKFSPKDPDIIHNLKFAKSKIKNNSEFSKNLYEKFALYWENNFGVYLFKYFVVCSYVLFVFLIFMARKSLKTKKLRYFLYFIILSVCFAYSLFIGRVNNEIFAKKGIVIGKKAQICFSPNETVAFEVYEGMKFKILKERDGWYFIELPDGKCGYIRKSEVGII